jgi:hypothetical protein
MLASPQWTLFALLLYCVFTQFIAMDSNGIFLSFRDWYRLGFRRPSWTYRIAYVTDYVMRDWWLADILALIVCLFGAIVQSKTLWGVIIWIVWVVNLCVLPSHAYLGFRTTAKARTIYLTILMSFLGGAALLYATGFDLPDWVWSWMPLWWPIFCMIYLLGLDVVTSRIHTPGFDTHGERRIFAWIRPLSPFLFKDLLLFYGMAVGAVFLAGCLFFALLPTANGLPKMLTVNAFIVLGWINLFMARKEKNYRLIAEDNVFSEQALPRDGRFIRHRKFGTLALGAMIPFALCCIVALSVSSSWRILLLAAAVFAAGLVIDAPLIIRRGALARRLRTVVKYSMILLLAPVIYTGGSEWSILVYCGVLCLLYAPSCIRVYGIRPRRVRSGDLNRTEAHAVVSDI